MAKSESETAYYVRVRGKAAGPYTLKQLNAFRARGQFSESNEISVDGETWQSAATLDAIFGGSTRTPRKQAAAVSNSEPDGGTPTIALSKAPEDLWYYSLEGQQLGPVPLTDLQQMITLGRFDVRDLVWKEGMLEWRRAFEVPELKDIAPPEKKPRSKRSKTQIVVQVTDDGVAPHFLDHVLAMMRDLISETWIVTAQRSSVEFGRYAVYASIILNLVLSFIVAVKLSNVNMGLRGTGLVMLAVAFHFSAIKSCGAIAQLLRSTPLRMSSNVFLDSVVIISLAIGIIALGGGTVAWIQTQQILEFVMGIAVFVGCLILSVMLLHPDALGIVISKNAGSGEEAIAILSFILTLPIRFVPATFAVLSVSSIITTLIAFLWAFSLKPNGIDLNGTRITIVQSGMALITCAAYPLLAYLYFVFIYLIVDIIRSILLVPDKLDHVAARIDKSPDSIQNCSQSPDTIGLNDGP